MPIQNLNQVEKYLDDVKTFDSANYLIVEKLRTIIFQLSPDIQEFVKYNGLMYKTEIGVGGIFSYSNYSSFEFSNGFQLEDKYNQLEGSGKFRRHIKFESLESIELNNFVYYFIQSLN
jgi:hypothetical protein